MKLETITLEDNKTYYILDTIPIENTKYLFLSEENGSNVVIRKLSQDEKDVIGLNTEEEYNNALNTYLNKYADLLS